MKRNNISIMVALAGITSVVFTSCMQGPAARKKMPGYLNAENFEAIYPFKTKQARANEYAFLPSDEALVFEGSVQKFMTIPVPDAGYDLIALDLLDKYKASASSLISLWKLQGNQGVIFDFSNGLQQGNSATYRLEKSGEFSVPVIFRWDANSATRADAFVTLLQNAPEISFKKIAN